MAKRSEAWKNLERSVALDARAVGFVRAFRVCRGDDIGISAVDVIIPEIPFVKIDSKYRRDSFYHHSLFFEAESKYVERNGDFMVLPTKGGRERGSLSTLRTEVLMDLLADKFIAKNKPANALGCPKCSGLAKPQKIGLDLSECTCQTCGLIYFLRAQDVPPGAEQALKSGRVEPDYTEHPLEILASDEDCQPKTTSKKAREKAKRITRAKKIVEPLNFEDLE